MLLIGVCGQVKKLKSLCENLFKLRSIKLRLFLHEEVREKNRSLFCISITFVSM